MRDGHRETYCLNDVSRKSSINMSISILSTSLLSNECVVTPKFPSENVLGQQRKLFQHYTSGLTMSKPARDEISANLFCLKQILPSGESMTFRLNAKDSHQFFIQLPDAKATNSPSNSSFSDLSPVPAHRMRLRFSTTLPVIENFGWTVENDSDMKMLINGEEKLRKQTVKLKEGATILLKHHNLSEHMTFIYTKYFRGNEMEDTLGALRHPVRGQLQTVIQNFTSLLETSQYEDDEKTDKLRNLNREVTDLKRQHAEKDLKLESLKVYQADLEKSLGAEKDLRIEETGLLRRKQEDLAGELEVEQRRHQDETQRFQRQQDETKSLLETERKRRLKEKESMQGELDDLRVELFGVRKKARNEQNFLKDCLYKEKTVCIKRWNELKELEVKHYDTLKEDLSCAICHEVLQQTTTLGCSHSFCLTCITTWKAKRKQCPTCRQPIKAQVRVLALDELVSKINQKDS